MYKISILPTFSDGVFEGIFARLAENFVHWDLPQMSCVLLDFPMHIPKYALYTYTYIFLLIF